MSIFYGASDHRMSAMSNMNRTSPLQPTGASPPPGARTNASLYLMLQKLVAAEAKFAILRQCLDDLETEHIEIRQYCEREIRACATADQDDREKERDHKRVKESKGLHSRDHGCIIEMPLMPDPGSQFPFTSPTPIPSVSGGRGSGAASGAKDEKSLDLAVSFSQQPQLPVAISRTQQPQPNHPFPRPEDVDLSSYPPELKIEGPDWFVLFNPSPKVKRVLDVNLVHTLQHYSFVHCVKFSRDGKWVATGCSKTAQIYNVETGVKTCVLDHCISTDDMVIRTVCFSPDGKYLATGTQDKQIRIWDIANKGIRNIFEGHQSGVWSLDFSSDGRFIVSGSADATVRIWDVHDGTSKVLTIDDHYSSRRSVTDLSISPDGRYVAVGSFNKVVSIWETSTGVLVQKLRGHSDIAYCVAFTPDGKGLVSGSLDGTLKYWDVSQLGIRSGPAGEGLVGSQRHEREGKGKKTDNTPLTSTLSSSTALSPCIMNITGHHDSVHSVSVSYDGAWVVSGSQDQSVQFWDARTGVVQCMLSGHDGTVLSADFIPADNFLATASEGFRARIWSY